MLLPTFLPLIYSLVPNSIPYRHIFIRLCTCILFATTITAKRTVLYTLCIPASISRISCFQSSVQRSTSPDSGRIPSIGCAHCLHSVFARLPWTLELHVPCATSGVEWPVGWGDWDWDWDGSGSGSRGWTLAVWGWGRR